MQDIRAVSQVVQPRAESHARPDAQTLPQRTSGHIHERQARRGMAFNIAAQLAQGEQIFRRQETSLRPRGIEQRGRVAFGENEPVVVRVARVFGIVAHVAKKKSRHQIGGRAARAGMTTPGRGRGIDGMNAQLIGDP